MTDKFVITGMTCAACAAHVERAAASVPGVHSASVNLMLGSLVCDHDDSAAPEAIIAAVQNAGYGAAPESAARRDLHAEQDAAVKSMGRRLLWSVICLVPLFYLSMGHMMGLPVPMFMHTQPLLAAFVGAAFVGVGAGLSVRAGGAPSGDDALAMSLSRLLRQPIERIYLISDLVVLAMSASYIPLPRLAYSLLTVILSGQLIGLIQRMGRKNPVKTTC